MQEKNSSKKSLACVVTGTALLRRWRWMAGALLLAALLYMLTSATGCADEVAGPKTTDASVMADTGGKIEIAETYYDFGSVPVGKMVEHSFTIKNTGSGSLKLGEVDVKLLEGC